MTKKRAKAVPNGAAQQGSTHPAKEKNKRVRPLTKAQQEMVFRAIADLMEVEGETVLSSKSFDVRYPEAVLTLEHGAECAAVMMGLMRDRGIMSDADGYDDPGWERVDRSSLPPSLKERVLDEAIDQNAIRSSRSEDEARQREDSAYAKILRTAQGILERLRNRPTGDVRPEEVVECAEELAAYGLAFSQQRGCVFLGVLLPRTKNA